MENIDKQQDLEARMGKRERHKKYEETLLMGLGAVISCIFLWGGYGTLKRAPEILSQEYRPSILLRKASYEELKEKEISDFNEYKRVGYDAYMKKKIQMAIDPKYYSVQFKYDFKRDFIEVPKNAKEIDFSCDAYRVCYGVAYVPK